MINRSDVLVNKLEYTRRLRPIVRRTWGGGFSTSRVVFAAGLLTARNLPGFKSITLIMADDHAVDFEEDEGSDVEVNSSRRAAAPAPAPAAADGKVEEDTGMEDDRYAGRGGVFESVTGTAEEGPAKCT